MNDINTLHIISNSPARQYRNACNVYLSRTNAEEMKIDLILVSTESGHGKDPMDEVIRCTEDLIKHLLTSNIVITKHDKENVDQYASLIAKNLAIQISNSIEVSINEWVLVEYMKKLYLGIIIEKK